MSSVYSPIKEVRETSTQIYDLRDASSVTVGWFLERYGSTTSYVNYAMPETQAYSSSAGTNVPIGIMPYTRNAIDSSTDEYGGNYRYNREIAPITDCDVKLVNRGSDIDIMDPIAACPSGFQEATGSMYKCGYALEDIQAGKEGTVRVKMSALETVDS